MRTILIIDDDRDVHDVYSEALSIKEYRVLSSYTGEDGLKKVEIYNPELILLDIDLGSGLTGLDVLHSLKKMKKKLPIIFISGKSGMEHDVEIEIAANVYKFFVKPIAVNELVHTIQEFFNPKLPLDNKEIRTYKSSISFKESLSGCSIESLLGQGASGEVYRASHSGVPVAIKIYKKDVLSDIEVITRFKESAIILKKIKHPNIIELFDTGITKEGNYFIIMQYFVGENVSSLLEKNGIISIPESIDIAYQIAQGLSAAHQAKLLHRDIKPSNILYNREKKIAKIIDFGVACKLGTSQDECITGTPYFMSPEQCQGSELDHRSDIYNLGATLYNMIVGTPPFYSFTDVKDVLLAHIYQPLAWPRQMSYIPNSLQKIVEKMMEKSASKRFSTMARCAEELKKIRASL